VPVSSMTRRVAHAVGLRWQPRRLWVRIAGAVASLVITFCVFVVLAFESTASASGGWLPVALALLPGLLLGAVTVGLGRWYTCVGYSVGLALLVGVWAFQTSPPEHDRIEAFAVQAGAPQGWTRVSRQARGNTWCLWNQCPTMDYVYATDDSPVGARGDFAAVLEADGWERDEYTAVGRADPEDYQEWHKGRWNVIVNVEPEGSPGREYDTTVAANLTKVSLTFR
jgi:hypothetical protein